MGMFDYVWITCPRCGSKLEGQSKGGQCSLIDYTLENAPDEVIEYMIGDTIYCKTCERIWAIKKAEPRTIQVILE